jgi:hypothetical protein
MNESTLETILSMLPWALLAVVSYMTFRKCRDFYCRNVADDAARERARGVMTGNEIWTRYGERANQPDPYRSSSRTNEPTSELQNLRPILEPDARRRRLLLRPLDSPTSEPHT